MAFMALEVLCCWHAVGEGDGEGVQRQLPPGDPSCLPDAEHLGYEPHERSGSGNARNGTTPKRLHTEAGSVDLDVPRDRDGSFEPRLVRKGQRRLDGLDKIVIGLYARGMTVRDIRAHLLEIYDVEVSPDLISTITDAVLD